MKSTWTRIVSECHGDMRYASLIYRSGTLVGSNGLYIVTRSGNFASAYYKGVMTSPVTFRFVRLLPDSGTNTSDTPDLLIETGTKEYVHVMLDSIASFQTQHIIKSFFTSNMVHGGGSIDSYAFDIQGNVLMLTTGYIVKNKGLIAKLQTDLHKKVDDAWSIFDESVNHIKIRPPTKCFFEVRDQVYIDGKFQWDVHEPEFVFVHQIENKNVKIKNKDKQTKTTKPVKKYDLLKGVDIEPMGAAFFTVLHSVSSE